MFPQFVNADVGPSFNELFIMQISGNDHVAHCQRDRPICAGKWRMPFITTTSRVRHPYVERYQFRSIFEASTLYATRKWNMTLMRFENVGSEVEDVL